MQRSRFIAIVSIALTFNTLGIRLPASSDIRSIFAPAAAQTSNGHPSFYLGQPNSLFQPTDEQTLNNQLIEASTLLTQGEQQLRKSQYQEAFQAWQKVLSICQDEHFRAAYPAISSRGRAAALTNLGFLLTTLNASQQGIEYLEQALPIFQDLNDRDGEAIVLLNLGVAYKKLEQYQKSIDYSEQALALFQTLNDRNGEAKILANLGAAYSGLQEHQQAITYSEQALPILREVNNRNDEALVLMNLGNVYGKLQGYQQGIDYYQQALPIFRELGDRDREGLILANIGKLYVNYNSPISAIQFLQQSLEVREAIRADMRQLPTQLQQAYLDSFADDYRLLAELLRQQNRHADAQQVLGFLR